MVNYRIDPVPQLLVRTGNTAFILLLLSLACTPIDLLFDFPRILTARKPLGLYAALYALLHFLVFAGLDYRFNLEFLLPAITDQVSVLLGLAALLILTLLAFTSTRGWQRRLGKGWKRLQRLVYAAAILIAAHVMWVRKSPLEASGYLLLLTVLLIFRLPPIRRSILRMRKQSQHDTEKTI